MNIPHTTPAPIENAVYTDEFLTHWADVYVERGIRDYGVQLEFFLIAPRQILAWIEAGRLRRLSELAGESLGTVRQFVSRRAAERVMRTENPIVHR